MLKRPLKKRLKPFQQVEAIVVTKVGDFLITHMYLNEFQLRNNDINASLKLQYRN